MPDFSLYNDIPIGVCVIKRDRAHLQVLYANSTLIKSLGFHDRTEVIGQEFETIWPTKYALAFAKALKGQNPPKNETLSYQSVEGEPKRWALISIQEVIYDNQDYFILWATDISAHKKLEKQLESAVQRADEGAEQKSNFLATMSHEIRTPMQSVYGLLEIIEQSKPDNNILSMAQTAKNSASGLLEILDDILDFAKMDADQMSLDHFEVPIRTLAYGINEAMAVKVQGKAVELLTDIDKEVPFVIAGDPKRLRQIIMNLMGNALKFTHQGNVTIKINTNCTKITPSKKQISLRFEIVDTGIGMQQEIADNLFTPFTQADNSTSRKYGGTGLGLSICKKLVELMGGEIGVISAEGKGSRFWFEIPTEEVSTEANALDMPALDGISVISVEDHPQGAKEIMNSLRSMGASVESCPTYTEGLELITARPFDVAIIDQGLPDGVGLDLVREAQQLRPSMGIIMYTVRSDAGLQHTLQSLGATYLTKPASRIGLGETVQDSASKSVNIQIDGAKKLLIAEDTASVRDILKRQLDMIGMDVTFAENGAEALEKLKTNEYGILITDLHMPEMDGYDLIQEIRKQDEENDTRFPVIVLTADVQMSSRQEYMKHGFDECLLKPVSLGQFKRLLIRWGLLDESKLVEGVSRENNAIQATQSIDQKAIIKQMGALNEDTINMLHMFIDMTEPMIGKLVKAHDDQDYHDLAEQAHSLKGAARSACANILGDIASKIQDASESQKNCTDDVEQIKVEFENVKQEIKNLKT